MFAFIFINLATSNFVLGAQSIDQIFFGVCLGLWLGYFCNAFIRKPLDMHVTRLLDGEYHVQGYTTLLKCLLGIILVDFIFVSAFFGVVDYLEGFDAHIEWYNKVIASCGTQADQLQKISFSQAEYCAVMVQLMSLGSYLGILCDTKFFKGTHRQIHDTSVWKGLLRMLITFVIFSPFLYLVTTVCFCRSFWQILLFVYVIPSFVLGFVFFALSR